MSNVEITAEDDKEYVEWRDTKVPYLRAMTDGKGPPEAPTGPDWLTSLEVGTVFACRANVNTVDWEMYFLGHKFTNIYMLKWDMPDGKVWERRVDPKLFCKHYKDFEIIAVYPPQLEQEAPKGDDDGNSDRTD